MDEAHPSSRIGMGATSVNAHHEKKVNISSEEADITFSIHKLYILLATH